MVDDPATIETFKTHVRVILGALKHDVGKRYEDYDSTTDKTADYGLGALIGGVAKKLEPAP